MLKKPHPFIQTLDFHSNVWIKTWQFTIYHQTREVKIIFLGLTHTHRRTQKLQNDQKNCKMMCGDDGPAYPNTSYLHQGSLHIVCFCTLFIDFF
jgi:hypothetical protein